MYNGRVIGILEGKMSGFCMQSLGNISKKEAIRLLVKTAVQTYAQGLRSRHEVDYDDAGSTLNMDIHMQNSDSVSKKEVIQLLVKTAVQTYAQGFQTRHEAEYGNPEGTLNMKIHNVFIAALGPEIQYYTALVRSLDSSLGNMLEKLAMNIAELSFVVQKEVTGPLTLEQTQQIAQLLERYKRRE